MDFSKYFTWNKSKAQTVNSAGGLSFAVDDWTRLDRFLVLGTEGGSYYASERKLTVDSADALVRCLESDGPRTVARIVEISETGRAPKNDPALFALACAAKLGNEPTRALAFAAVSRVARIGTHLFHFLTYLQLFGGWGRGTRRAIARWYDDKPVRDLAYQLVKYQSRDGWTHRDVLRLAKPRKASGARDALYGWATRATLKASDGDGLDLVYAFEQAKRSGSIGETVTLIRDHRLPRECVKTEHLNAPEVWDALLPAMKPEALVRNLGKMSAVGLLSPMSDAERTIVARLTDGDVLKKARLHPVKVLAALLTYRSGKGVRGQLTWDANERIVDALDHAFYATFGNVQPSNQRTMLALDVSGSMSGGIVAGVPGLSPRIASAAMALVTAATEPRHSFTAFTRSLVPLAISPRQRLDDVVRSISSLPFGATDCAQPMLYALERKLEIDTFVVYTDSETWAGKIQPVDALRQYRQKMGVAAKLVVVGMVANAFTIADPNDAGMLDVVGFDTSTPELVTSFARESAYVN